MTITEKLRKYLYDADTDYRTRVPMDPMDILTLIEIVEAAEAYQQHVAYPSEGWHPAWVALREALAKNRENLP